MAQFAGVFLCALNETLRGAYTSPYMVVNLTKTVQGGTMNKDFA